MKLLKQFHSAPVSHTPLKRGVNETCAKSAMEKERTNG
jgi:hypothetical protein